MRSRRFLLAYGLALATATCGAFTFTPMSVSLEPQGKWSAQTFRIENTSSNRVAFQISVLTREMYPDGTETNRPVEGQFAVFPPQGSVGPGGNQNVRVVWKGDPNPGRELSFRLLAEELPVNFTPETGQARIRLVLRYLAAVYVTPKDAKADLQVAGIQRTDTNTYVLSVENRGTAHRILQNPKLTLTDAQGRDHGVPSEALKPLVSENLLAGALRKFVVTLPPEFTEANYQGKLTADE